LHRDLHDSRTTVETAAHSFGLKPCEPLSLASAGQPKRTLEGFWISWRESSILFARALLLVVTLLARAIVLTRPGFVSIRCEPNERESRSFPLADRGVHPSFFRLWQRQGRRAALAAPTSYRLRGSRQTMVASQMRWKRVPNWHALERVHLIGAAGIHATANMPGQPSGVR
jgi:hypothetical protein